MFKKLEKFDTHLKLADSIYQQTLLGGILTFLSVIIISYLIISETYIYLQKDIVNHLVKDNNQGFESIKLLYQIEFYSIECDKLTMSQEIIRGIMHYTEHNEVIKEPILSDESISKGCKVTGDTITDKIGGIIKFQVKYDIFSMSTIDLSHKINYFAFLPANELLANEETIPGVHNPLNNQETIIDDTVGIYQYSLDIIPTEYTNSFYSKYVVNQYSVNKRKVSVTSASNGVVISNQNYQNFFGVLFTYDFSPVKLVLKDQSESFFEFLSNLCGIVGGTITVLMLIERLLHQSAKALIGKRD